MAKVLVLKKAGFDKSRKPASGRKLFPLESNRFNNSGKVNISAAAKVFFLIFVALLSGMLYLSQVNNIATKGFEIRELENKIRDLEKEEKKLQIKEVELKSMDNIEKSLEELNLVNSTNVSYVEVDGPVAMK